MFGKILGTFFNIFLLLFFLLYLTSEIAGLCNIMRIFIINFLSPLKVYIVITFLGAYPVYKGLKVLGRTNETIFYLTLVMCSLLVVGIIRGNILNICPIFGASILNIIKSSMDSTYQYAGMEMYLVIYPYVLGDGNKQNLALKAAFITALIYTWLTFVTIYCLGIDIIPKSLVSVPIVAKFIQLPVINNFRFIFMVLWSLVVINLISNYYYGVVTSLNSIFTKLEAKNLYHNISFYCFFSY